MRQLLRFLVHFEMFHQQRMHLYAERIYSLMVLKKITAEELYEQKVPNEIILFSWTKISRVET